MQSIGIMKNVFTIATGMDSTNSYIGVRMSLPLYYFIKFFETQVVTKKLDHERVCFTN